MNKNKQIINSLESKFKNAYLNKGRNYVIHLMKAFLPLNEKVPNTVDGKCDFSKKAHVPDEVKERLSSDISLKDKRAIWREYAIEKGEDLKFRQVWEVDGSSQKLCTLALMALESLRSDILGSTYYKLVSEEMIKPYSHMMKFEGSIKVRAIFNGKSFISEMYQTDLNKSPRMRFDIDCMTKDGDYVESNGFTIAPMMPLLDSMKLSEQTLDRKAMKLILADSDLNDVEPSTLDPYPNFTAEWTITDDGVLIWQFYARSFKVASDCLKSMRRGFSKDTRL